MPDAHNVVVATSRRVATLTQYAKLAVQAAFGQAGGLTTAPTTTLPPTAASAEVEINYYVIEESNCDRQRCGKPLAMAANRFTSCVSETPPSPLSPRLDCRPCIHQSHSLFDQLSRLGCLPPQLAICETRNALFMLLL